MIDADAIELVEMLAAAFPKQPLPPQTIAVYARMLRDLDRVAVESAIIGLMATATFFPAIAEIRKAVAEAANDIPDWEVAWDEVTAARRQYGSYIGPRWGNDGGFWSSPLVESALRHVGGYPALCAVTYDDEPTLRAQFRDIYRRSRDAAIKRIQVGAAALDPAAPQALTGHHDATPD